MPDAASFSFCFISKGRPGNVVMVEEVLFGNCSCKSSLDICWFVGQGEESAYRKAGASKVKAGGGLSASRNAALDYAHRNGRLCVQISDDVQGLTFQVQRVDLSVIPCAFKQILPNTIGSYLITRLLKIYFDMRVMRFSS